MPYPWWVNAETRTKVISRIERMVAEAQAGKRWTWKDDGVRDLGALFEFPSGASTVDGPRAQRNTGGLFELAG